MQVTKKTTQQNNIVSKVINSVSFNSDRLAEKKQISKERESYIKDISARALSAVNA